MKRVFERRGGIIGALFKMGFWLLIFFAIAVVAFLYFFKGSPTYDDTPSGKAFSEKAKPVYKADAGGSAIPVGNVTASELFSIYNDNEYAFMNQYNGKYCRVTGEVRKVSVDKDNVPHIEMACTPVQSIDVLLAKSLEAKAADLRKGDEISIIGVVVGEKTLGVMKSLRITNAVFAKPEKGGKSPAGKPSARADIKQEIVDDVKGLATDLYDGIKTEIKDNIKTEIKDNVREGANNASSPGDERAKAGVKQDIVDDVKGLATDLYGEIKTEIKKTEIKDNVSDGANDAANPGDDRAKAGIKQAIVDDVKGLATDLYDDVKAEIKKTEIKDNVSDGANDAAIKDNVSDEANDAASPGDERAK